MLPNLRIERTWPSPIGGAVDMNGPDFGRVRGLLKAGHAAHPPCWAAVERGCER
jgi:hypothetical protein